MESLPEKPVAEEVLDAILDELRERFGQALEADRGMVPQIMPYWDAFIVDDAGRLWVQEYHYTSGPETTPRAWHIYGEAGVHLGTLNLPIANRPLPVVRGNRLAGVVRDELGVTSVVVYSLGISDDD